MEAEMATDTHNDGGRLWPTAVSHRHVVDDDGSVSAVVVRGVPVLACELCEATYYEPAVTDRIVEVIEHLAVAPGEAVAVSYPKGDAA